MSTASRKKFRRSCSKQPTTRSAAIRHIRAEPNVSREGRKTKGRDSNPLPRPSCPSPPSIPLRRLRYLPCLRYDLSLEVVADPDAELYLAERVAAAVAREEHVLPVFIEQRSP